MNSIISIIIPVYNVEKYLKECLDSILQQTYPHLQIICVDDGSTDSSGSMLDEYAKCDSRILVIHQKNGGVGKAFNTGYNEALGTYIGYIEPDDYIEKNMYEELLEIIERDRSDIARCNFVTFDSAKKQEEPTSNTIVAKYHFKSPISPSECEDVFLYHPAIWCNLYKKSLLDDNSIRMIETPGASFQDNSFFFEVLSCTRKISLINKDLYHYRVHAHQSAKSAKVWFYEKINEKAISFIATVQDKELADYLSIMHLRRNIHNYEYSLQILSKDEIPKMCQLIVTETRKIPDSWINQICITRREKLLYIIFKYNLTYLLYLAFIPISIFTQRSVKNKKIIYSLLHIFG